MGVPLPSPSCKSLTSSRFISAAKPLNAGLLSAFLAKEICPCFRACFSFFQASICEWNHLPGLRPVTTWLAFRCCCQASNSCFAASSPAHSYRTSSKPSALLGKVKRANSPSALSTASGTPEQRVSEASSGSSSPSAFLASMSALCRIFTHSRKSAGGLPRSTAATFRASGCCCKSARRSASNKPRATLLRTRLRPLNRARVPSVRRASGSNSPKASRSGSSLECSGPGALLR
mmetsp:Transcript_42651/g.101635  ORF Transcript_42651/g.101635 Transcript_42651/m.101635 type:complete len:233 (-) Transcript_42651:926-1624(-)